MNRLVIFSFIILSNISLAQKVKDTIYLDENNTIINKFRFTQKLNSTIYYGLTFDSDTIVYQKIRFSYFFGKIDPLKKQQLFKYLSARNGVDTTKMIAIHYEDTLKPASDFPKHDSVAYTKERKQHKHIRSYKSYIKGHKQCHKNFKKRKNASVYHYYNTNLGHKETYKKLSWHQDHQRVLRRIFKDKYKPFNSYIIKPNGDYVVFIYYIRNGGFEYSDIFKKDRWKQAQKLFKRKLKSHNPKIDITDLDKTK